MPVTVNITYFYRFLHFLVRLVIATFAVGSFFVVTQDLQIFPGALSSVWKEKGGQRVNAPPGIEAGYVTTEDGEQIEVWHLPVERPLPKRSDASKYREAPEHHELPRAVALVFHGNGDTVETAYFLQRWLKELGISSYSFDYRGYGRSSGWPSEEGLQHDARAVYRLMEERYPLTDLPVVLMGSSLGTGVAAAFAANTPEADILVLLSPYSSIPDVVRQMPLYSVLAPFLWYEFPTLRALSSTTMRCIVLAHGIRDTTIPVSHSRVLSEALGSIHTVRTVIVESAGHNNLMAVGRASIANALQLCLEKQSFQLSGHDL